MPRLMVQVEYPSWVEKAVDWERRYSTDEEKMGLAIELSRLNVQHRTGEPFGAAIFRSDTGRLIAVGMSQVVLRNNSVLHAEVVAIMMAEQRLQAYNLRVGGYSHELISSCEPCAMCLGAIHWSAVTRLVCGATREDAQRIGFDEGPVFPESYSYLAQRGVEIVREVLRKEANAVIQAYLTGGGLIHNLMRI
ncbi:MAG TPA: nucleoside deaminase [Candidatus Binatia bacterium]|nr:nucleoside deaminase [Candidatus Binatia bacterium]